MRAHDLAITGPASVWIVVLVACGAATEPLTFGGPDASTGGDGSSVVDSGVDSGAPIFDSSPPQDTGADVTAPEEAGPPCDVDADLDAALCTPPDDDLLIADPPVVTVAAGSYGVARFKATGPWATDPNMFVWFDGASVSLQFTPWVLPNQPPTGFLFQVASTASDVQGTFTAVGHDGNIERTATLTVNVTGCQPWSAAMACQSYDCGFQADNCGGLVSCGTCSAAAPYCFLGSCTAATPTYCPDGQGITPSGCIPCSSTRTCIDYCRDARCAGLQDVCFCEPWTYPACPLSPPPDGSACENTGQACSYYNSCYESYTSTCEPSGAWSTPPIPSCQ
jgi:hypothetical protein